MNRLTKLLPAVLGVGLGLLVANESALGQTKNIDITVDDPTPLGAAILKIEELSGIPINYESIPVYYSADLLDVTSQMRTPTPGARIMAVRSGQLSASIIVDATTGRLKDIQAVQAALAAIISAYNSSGLPGGSDFELYNGVFFVKPVRYRDATGAIQAMAPILSTPITLPEERRDVTQTLDLILNKVSRATGFKVTTSWFANPYAVTFGAQNEPADHVIARFLASGSTPAPLPPGAAWDVGKSYRLLFEPNLRFYALSVHRVPNSNVYRGIPNKPYSPPPRLPNDNRGTRRVP